MRNQPGLLLFPGEYQRGKAWSKSQKQLFVDSVLRGYAIPAFYFHWDGDRRTRRGERQDLYHVIDGQQRIRALQEFRADEFKLLDNAGFKFPNFADGQPRPWEGMQFSALSEEMQNHFNSRPVVIYKIFTEGENDDEVRDLFIRLQGGTPLTPQDKRDAWPGKFTDFILKTGGKAPNDPEDVGYPGHGFFETHVKVSEKGGAKRQLAAQVAMLFLNRRDEDAGKFREFCGISSQHLDEFYRQNVAFDLDGENARKFRRMLDKLVRVFGDARPQLAGHEVIHLALLADSLMEGYAPGWENNLPPKFTEFRRRCKDAREAAKSGGASEYSRYYDEYSRWTASSAAEASSIQRRHVLFLGEMLKLLAPTPLDNKRQADHLTKEIVYYRDEKQCQWCAMNGDRHPVSWANAEFHHIDPHAKGGKSAEENLALVDAECHKRLHSQNGAENFQAWWREKKANMERMKSEQAEKKARGKPLPPDGTKCQFHSHQGEIVKRKLVVDGVSHKSFSGACSALAGRPMNGWTAWRIQLPDSDRWMLADDWRKGG